MNVLVTGGAGYIGSHAVRCLQCAGHEVWIVDNLSRGHRRAVPADRLIVGDIADRELLVRVLDERRIEAVLHCAGFAEVGESMLHPARYYQNNVVASLSLLETLRVAGVTRIVFSSTTATYGAPARVPIAEDDEQRPINPYGFSKLVVERALEDYSRAYGFACATLRYFNAAGAALAGDLGEHHEPESRLIPLALQVALGQRPHLTIFGDDFPTPDGTCIRDYIHVDDLSDAHLRALERLTPGRGLRLNLGTGRGHSVREVIDTCRRVTGREIPVRIGPRRDGDPPELVADPRRAQETLGWRPQFSTLESIVATAWNWHRTHPRGFDTPAENNSTQTGADLS